MKKIVSCLMALMLVIFATFPVFAAEDVKSPDGTFRYKISVDTSTGGGGNANYEITSEIDSNGVMGVRISAVADSGYKFDHWVIDGAYTTNGSLSDAILDINITSDIIVTAYFVSTSGTTDATQVVTNIVQKDTGSSSPKTGRNDAPLYLIIFFAVAACSVATFKFVKSK